MRGSGRSLAWMAALGAALLAYVGTARADDERFEKTIRPLLAGTCFRCHGGEREGGGLRVDGREALLKGGDSGPAVVPGKPEESLLLEAIGRMGDAPKMPPQKALGAEAVAAVRQWIAEGAPWPASTEGAKAFRSEAHWAFRPPVVEKAPEASGSSWIDAYLNDELRKHDLKAVEGADRRTLVRRLTFDLTGLPPTAEEVEGFVEDRRVDAYERLVDRLLASPRYGERWGRHWLDVVRYADTAGETADFPVPDAWRYRNWVVSALNRDMPYDAFVRAQIAGDVSAGGSGPAGSGAERAEAITATGFLATARRFGYDITKDQHLTIEDTIDVLGKSVLGLTIACARCHDHKYDPVSQKDYYALYGVFASSRYPFPGCEKDKRPKDNTALVAEAEIAARSADFDRRISGVEATTAEPAKLLTAIGATPAAWKAEGEIPNGGSQGFGEGRGASALKDVAVRRGEVLRLTILPKNGHGADSTLVDWSIRELEGSGRRWGLTDDVLPRFGVDGQGAHVADRYGNPDVWSYADVAAVPTPLTVFVRDAERTPGLMVWRGAADTPAVMANVNEKVIKWITVTQPARSLAAHPGPSGGVSITWRSPMDGRVAIEGRVRDIDPTGGDGIAWEIRAHGDWSEPMARMQVAAESVRRLKEEKAAYLAAVPTAYAMAEGKVGDVPLQKRGEPDQPGDVVPRRWLTLFGGESVPPDAGSGRVLVAERIADRSNPLTARVIVNRVWRHHFGVGLVKTPNDFGTRGAPPSHPALLDALATRFVNDGWSLKRLHREIVLTDAYRRTSRIDAECVSKDPDDTWLWRFRRRRLDAEEIRDAMLSVAGALDGSPAEGHPFPAAATWGFTQHAPFATDYATDRRSLYLMIRRQGRHPFLALFDGADPNASTPDRFRTTVATQALYFLNDPFVHRMGESFARRLEGEGRDLSARLELAYRAAYGRGPSSEEIERAGRFIEAYAHKVDARSDDERGRAGPAAWLRVMMTSNEFLYVD